MKKFILGTAIALAMAACSVSTSSGTSGGGTVATSGAATDQKLCAVVADPQVTGKNLVFAHGGPLDQLGPDLDAVVRDKNGGISMITDSGSLQLDLIGATKASIANIDQDLANLKTDCQQQAG